LAGWSTRETRGEYGWNTDPLVGTRVGRQWNTAGTRLRWLEHGWSTDPLHGTGVEMASKYMASKWPVSQWPLNPTARVSNVAASQAGIACAIQ